MNNGSLAHPSDGCQCERALPCVGLVASVASDNMTTVASLQPQRRPSLSLQRPNPGPGGRPLVLLMQVQEKTEEIFRPPTSFVQTRKKPRFLLRRRRRVLYNLRSISSVIYPNHTEQIVPTTSLCF